MNYLAHILALLLFVLAAFGVKFSSVDITDLGLAFLTAGFILPGGLPWAPKAPNAA